MKFPAIAYLCETVEILGIVPQPQLTRTFSLSLPFLLLLPLHSFHPHPTQATAIENYVRLCVVREDEQGGGKHNWFTKANTTGVLLFIWLIGLLVSAFQFITTGEDDNATLALFDYCNRKNNEMLPSGVAVAVTSTLIPLFATFVIYLRIHMRMQRRVRKTNYKPNYWFSSDLALAKSNFCSFIIFILFWTPFAVVACLATTRPVTNQSFYNSAWVGMSKSCFYNIIYCLTHRHFRNAYVNLFNYCCCKTSFVATSRRHRDCGNTSGGSGLTGGGTGRPASDVRVHIIPGYNMYSYTSPQRRDVHEL